MKAPLVESATLIRLIAGKVKALSYLIENRSDEVVEPLDVSEVHWGLGLLLEEISQELKSISIQLERSEMKRKNRGG